MDIPASQETVTVRIIDTTCRIDAPNDFVEPRIKGTERLDCPSFAFLIEHNSGRKLLFDLGVRKDIDKLPPAIQNYFEHGKVRVSVEDDVHSLLVSNQFDPQEVEGIIWSHWHWDHIGDPSTFPSSTALIVGPGVRQTFSPGFPENPASPILQTDYEGRQLREVNFQDPGAVKIGGLDAIDYFGDGSFYILDAPGHTIGHLCGLARTTGSPQSFILMGADACHHSGEMRPSKWRPLPTSISPHPLETNAVHSCPGATFESLLRKGDSNTSFFAQKKPGMVFCDPDIAEQTIEKLQAFDAEDNIFIVIAHDNHLHDVIDLFPRSANDFLARGWHLLTKWRFLSDFKEALSMDVPARAS